MIEKNLLPELEKLLTRRRSKSFYAEKLGITIKEVEELLKEIRNKDSREGLIVDFSDLEKEIDRFIENSKKVNEDKGTLESSIICDYEPKSSDELYDLHKICRKTYKISTYWSKLKSNGKFTSSVLASLIKSDSPEVFQDSFKEFLKGFKPSHSVIKGDRTSHKPKISLILPKQDAHFNKLDIYGDNDIEERFSKNQKSILNMLLKASSTNSIEEVVYIVGSDQFNSEWTNCTTKFTPQQNILSYQGAFTEICNHEVEVINTLLHYSDKVKLYFIPGNHDQYVGWHLINWLETYYREDKDISFNSSIENTKYYKYNNSAVMLNHGDDMKPKDLAQKFPIGFKEQWSSCDNYYILTGDKHTELSMDINGIKFYRVPQLSSAKSLWDDKKGFIDSKAEMTAFVITQNNGMSDIYKDLL